MATVANLNVRISADIKQFQRGMSQIENQVKQVGSSLRGVGRTLSTAVTLPILGIAGAAVKAASDVEEMQAKFNTVFKTVGGSVSKELGKFAKQVNRSRYDLQGMAATFGDIIKPMGFTEESAADMSITLTKLAVDLSSFNNMPMDEAVRRLRGTLIGAHENAAEFGVIINENTLKQEMMRMGADKLSGSQKEQAKVQARLNLLLKGTTDAQGDATRTSGSFANQMRGLHDATRDVGVQFGEMLLPVASELVLKMQDLVGYLQTLSPSMKQFAIGIAGAVAIAGPLVFALGGLASALSAIFRAISLTMGLFNPYVAGFAAIAAIVVAVIRNFDGFQAAIVGAFQYLMTSLSPLIDGIISFVTSIIGSLVAVGAEITHFFVDWFVNNKEEISGVWVAVTTIIGTAFEIIGTIVEVGTTALILAWRYIAQPIIATVTLLFESVANLFYTGFELLKNTAETGIDVIKAVFRGDFGDAWTAFTTGFKDGLGILSDSGAEFKDDFLNAVDIAVTDFDEKVKIKDWRNQTEELLGELPSIAYDLTKEMVQRVGQAVAPIADENDPSSPVAITARAAEQIETNLDFSRLSVDFPDIDQSWFDNLRGNLENASLDAGFLGQQFGAIRESLSILYKEKLPEWMQTGFTWIDNFITMVDGFNALVKILSKDIWIDFVNNLAGIGKAILGIVQNLIAWATSANAAASAQTALNAATNPNVASGAVNTATGRGTVGAGLGLLGGATVGATLGIFGYGLQQMLTSTHQSLLEQGLSTAQIGTAISLGGLLQGVGAMGGGTPSWLSGLQGYMGTGGSANTSGIMGGMGMTTGGQTINVNLDGHRIATATMPYWSQELEIYGTNR